MIDSIECVVIGSGSLGASTAWHLASAGRSVALIDQHALGSQTSPRAAGLSSQARGTDLMTALAKRAVRKIESFAEDTGRTGLLPARRTQNRPQVPNTSRSSRWSVNAAAATKQDWWNFHRPRRATSIPSWKPPAFSA